MKNLITVGSIAQIEVMAEVQDVPESVCCHHRDPASVYLSLSPGPFPLYFNARVSLHLENLFLSLGAHP